MRSKARPSLAGLTFAVLAGMLAAFVLPSLASPMALSIIVERRDSSIEIFVEVPAARLNDVFGVVPSEILNDNGTVAIDRLREGTWDVADALMQSTNATLGEKQLRLEGMSMMVHPSNLPVPFRDAIDGITAIGVCQVLPSDGPLYLDDTIAYSGFIGYGSQTGRPLRLDFPITGRLPRLVEIRDYADGKLLQRSWSLLEDGGSLTIGGAG
ncbi:MAG: hypothetical protein AAGF59_10700 [Pseudomonadota bacterium]